MTGEWLVIIRDASWVQKLIGPFLDEDHAIAMADGWYSRKVNTAGGTAQAIRAVKP